MFAISLQRIGRPVVRLEQRPPSVKPAGAAMTIPAPSSASDEEVLRSTFNAITDESEKPNSAKNLLIKINQQ